ncbi:MAG: hypothetical protein QNJ35_13865 [Paracoccaceae bacterium]|nr:hypothetical protein [Paracoccaceae bacterium]
MTQKVTLHLEKDEALVLFAILTRELEQDDWGKFSSFSSSAAEVLALILLQCALETELVEPFESNYDELVARAKSKLVERYGDLPG